MAGRGLINGEAREDRGPSRERPACHDRGDRERRAVAGGLVSPAVDESRAWSDRRRMTTTTPASARAAHKRVKQRVAVGVDDEDAADRERSCERARRRARAPGSPARARGSRRWRHRPRGTRRPGRRSSTTASTPMKIEVGFSQLENMCPAALPTGTRLVAIAPTAAPSANGVRIEESEKIVSITARLAIARRTLAERICRAAEDDPQRGDEQRHGERGGDRSECPSGSRSRTR